MTPRWRPSALEQRHRRRRIAPRDVVRDLGEVADRRDARLGHRHLEDANAAAGTRSSPAGPGWTSPRSRPGSDVVPRIGTSRVCGTAAGIAPEADPLDDAEPPGELDQAVRERLPAVVGLRPGQDEQVACRRTARGGRRAPARSARRGGRRRSAGSVGARGSRTARRRRRSRRSTRVIEQLGRARSSLRCRHRPSRRTRRRASARSGRPDRPGCPAGRGNRGSRATGYAAKVHVATVHRDWQSVCRVSESKRESYASVVSSRPDFARDSSALSADHVSTYPGGYTLRSRVARRAPSRPPRSSSRHSSWPSFAPVVGAHERPRGHDPVSGRRRRAGLQGQLRPDRHVDAHRRRRAVAGRRAERLDGEPPRRRLRRRRRRGRARQAGHGPPRRRASRPTRRPATSTIRVTARRWRRRGRAADRGPRRRRGRRRHHADDQHAGADRRLGQASFTFDLTFKNDTAQDVTVSATRDRPAGWDVDDDAHRRDQAASTVVKAGATQSISVAATPAEDAPAGTYPIKVTATAGDRTDRPPTSRSRSPARTR